jgi:CRISPR-associated exonuclease Cas4
MRAVSISEGALWYWQERLREVVVLDEHLRTETLICIDAARAVLQSRNTPPPTSDIKRCKACSLIDDCVPALIRKDRSVEYAQALFEVSTEDKV